MVTIAGTRRTLVVVAFAVDGSAFAIDHAIERLALGRRHDAIGAGTRLGAIDALFALLEAIGLAAGQ